MDKKEYEYNLIDLSSWHYKRTEEMVDYWNPMEPTNKYIAVSLITLAGVMLEREFYRLDQKKDEYQGFLSRLLSWRYGGIKEILDCWDHNALRLQYVR